MSKQLSQDQISGANRLLDSVSALVGARNDADLYRKSGVSPAVISHVRTGRMPVGNAMLIKFHELTDKPIRELRAMMEPVGLSAATQHN